MIPVLDVMGGKVVHGRQTSRERYPPVEEVSEVVDGSGPVEVAEAFPSDRVYVADLDALEGSGGNSAAVRRLSEKREVLLDPGISTVEGLEEAREVAEHPVMGTETCPFEVMEAASGDEFVSLDVEGGEVPEVSERLPGLDLAGVILLFLDRVGTGSGARRDVVEEVVEAVGHPVFVGGGVSSEREVEMLGEAGAEGVLVSTALHRGEIEVGR